MKQKIIRAWKGITLTMPENADPTVALIYTVKTDRSNIPLYQGLDHARADSAFEEAVKATPKR